MIQPFFFLLVMDTQQNEEICLQYLIMRRILVYMELWWLVVLAIVMAMGMLAISYMSLWENYALFEQKCFGQDNAKRQQ